MVSLLCSVVRTISTSASCLVLSTTHPIFSISLVKWLMNRCLFSLYTRTHLSWSLSPVKCTVTPEQVPVLLKCVASFVEGSFVYPSKNNNSCAISLFYMIDIHLTHTIICGSSRPWKAMEQCTTIKNILDIFARFLL